MNPSVEREEDIFIENNTDSKNMGQYSEEFFLSLQKMEKDSTLEVENNSTGKVKNSNLEDLECTKKDSKRWYRFIEKTCHFKTLKKRAK